MVKGGIPVYYCVALQDCGEFGGVDAESLNKSIDDIFEIKVKLSEDKYKYGVVSTTADGASVNFDKY